MVAEGLSVLERLRFGIVGLATSWTPARVVGVEQRMGPFGELAVAMRWRVTDADGAVTASGWLGDEVTLALSSGARTTFPLRHLGVRAPWARWSRASDVDPVPRWLARYFVLERSVWWELPIRAGLVVGLEGADARPANEGYRQASPPRACAVLHLR